MVGDSERGKRADFHDGLPGFHPIVLKERDIRYNDNDCHPGKVIRRNITYKLSVIDGRILLQIPS